MGLKKPPVAAAAIHQAGGQLAAKLGPGFRNDARQPFDSSGLGGLDGKFCFIKHGGGSAFTLLLDKVGAADELNRQGVVITGFIGIILILGVIVQILWGEAVGGEPGFFPGGEKRVGASLAAGVKAGGLSVEIPKGLGKVVIFHGARILMRSRENATGLL